MAVGHAPHTGRTFEDRTAWWSKISTLLRRHQHQRHCILLLDANAQIGSHTTEHIGGLHAAEEDDNGRRLHELLVQTQCWIPSTFAHTGDPATWYSQAAHQRVGRRIDYVALPLILKNIAIESWSSETLDAGHAGIDHLAACLHLHGGIPGRRTRPCKGDGVDWQAVRKHQDDSMWRTLSARLPQPHWTDDPHLHWQKCHEGLIAELRSLFPRQPRQARRHYISDESWTLRNTRNYYRNLWRKVAKAGNDASTEAALIAWRRGHSLEHFTLSYRVAGLLETFASLQARCKLKNLADTLRKQIKLDRATYLEELSRQANDQPSKIYQILRKAGFGSQRKKRFNPLPMIKTAEGTTCSTLQELQREWLDYFADIEGGHASTSGEILQLCQHDEVTLGFDETISWSDLPTLKDIEDAFRKCKLHTAAGTDKLVPELFHRAPKWFAKWLYPLFMKMAIYASEPVHWKGGILFAVYKSKGETCNPTSYRGILVSSHVGKVAHGLFRKMAVPGFVQMAMPLQCGGIPKRSVAFAAHSCRLQQHAAQRAKMSTGILFVDIKSAYYRLLRELCVETRVDEGHLRFLLHRLRLPPEQLMPLLDILKTYDPVMAKADVPDIAKRMAAAFHRNTWFHVCGAPLLARTLRGARPGDGWADLLFNYLIAQVLCEFETSLADEGLRTTIAWNGIRGLDAAGGDDFMIDVGVTAWADDLAFMQWHESAHALIDNLQGLAERLVPHLAARGLQLNFASGKTEAVVCLRGHRSVQLRRQLFGVPEPGLHLEADDENGIKLRLLPQYIHLGGILHGKSRMKPELQRRLGIAQAAFAQHRASVYQNRHLSLTARVRLFEACVLSTAYFNCGTWTNLQTSDLNFFHNGILRLYRRILAKEVPNEILQHWPAAKLCSKLGLPEPASYLKLKRLSYYGTVLAQAPVALWSLIAAEGVWITYVKEDLQWLHELTIGRSSRPSPTQQPTFWDSLIYYNYGSWKGLLRKVRVRHLQEISRQSEIWQWYRDVGPFLEEAGVCLFKEEKTGHHAQHACFRCRMTFKSKSAWSVHAFKIHKRKARARYIADGLTCDHCGHTYLSNSRLVRHLSYSDPCAAALRARGLVVEPEPGIRSRAWNRSNQDDRCPWQQTEGPRHRAMPMQVTLTDDQLAFSEELFDVEESCIETASLHPEDEWLALWTERIREICAYTVLHPEELYDTLRAFIIDFETRYEAEMIGRYLVFDMALATVLEFFHPFYIQPELSIDKEVMMYDVACTEQNVRQMLGTDFSYVPHPNLAPRFHQPVFVHIYSGRRRKGDLQHAIEQIAWGPCHTPLVISLDLMVDASTCNMSDATQRQFWLSMAYRGFLDAGWAGPPCETWSAARHNPTNGPNGPRPLRSALDLWGIGGLDVREGRQIGTANILLHFAVMFHVVMWLKGRWQTLEHPKEPFDANFASIWKLPLIRLLLGLPGFTKKLIWQGFYQGLSPKPTELLMSHPPASYDALALRMRTSALPPPLRMGREEGASHYNTAPLKEYPPDFCSLQAAALKAWMDERPLSPEAPELPSDILLSLKSLVVDLSRSVEIFGPDFAEA